MRKKTLLFGGAVVMLGAMILVSCNKSAEIKSTPIANSTTDKVIKRTISLQELAGADASEQLSYALDPQLAVSEAVNSGSCPPIITYDNPEGVYPRTVTTDYGFSCTYAAAGITRSGKVIRTYYGDMTDTTSLSYYVETYDNYYVKNAKLGWDSVRVEGSLRMRHESKNKDPQTAYRETFNNRKFTEINGDYVIANGVTRLVKREDDGFYPQVRVQGRFKLTGVTTADAFSGGVSYQYTDSIDDNDPIIYKHCEYTVAGTRYINFSNQPAWKIVYGTLVNECDDQAELTINGVTTTVTLPIDTW
ncbi:hypothetical protein FRZ67_01735 [Panacibacter ginsenosidivorans]|uniref:Lipoprotein n=1 Tax=Panacibacter ginsenosidivorans TaxID=1813871 RepID=A0A5B8V625_9BACT|nr:hypothetical protein [Panacibacter ginsenosidivorans]QEC66086.1 hypothetical protein FRZ67_01735 [Panacibacter ginsenosidivorans]